MALRAFPLLSPRCAMREGGQRQRGGAAAGLGRAQCTPRDAGRFLTEYRG
jgi:hypothetical protein